MPRIQTEDGELTGLLAALGDTAGRAEQAGAASKLILTERDELVVAALAAGATHAQVAEAAGFSRGRVDQIAKGAR